MAAPLPILHHRVVDGQQAIELCIGAHDTTLLVDGLPCAIVWKLPGQRAKQFVLRAYDSSSLDDTLGLVADQSITSDAPIALQLRTILGQFADGDYELEVHMTLEVGAADQGPRPQGAQELTQWLGLRELWSDVPPLVGTMPREALNRDRVRSLAASIRMGARPPVVVITADEAHAAFVVAGHHALEAYGIARVEPTVVAVTHLTPRFLSVQESCVLVRIAHERCASLGVDVFKDPQAPQLPLVPDVG